MSMNASPDEAAATAANTLVLSSAFDTDREAVCAEQLRVGNPGETNVLFVTLTGSPDTCLDRWRRHVGDHTPANMGFVSVDETARSTAAASGTVSSPTGAVRSVPSPGDMTGLGIAIGESLSAWHDNGATTVVCFDSLTSLLQYADTERVFQFVHVLTRRVESAGAIAHYHMDPGAHEERVVRTIASLFDNVLDGRDADDPTEPVEASNGQPNGSPSS